MPRTHRTYDSGFRQEAVNLLLSSGRPLERIAAELGISANALRGWRDQALGQGRAAQPAAARESGTKGRSKVPLADAAGEIRRLVKQVLLAVRNAGDKFNYRIVLRTLAGNRKCRVNLNCAAAGISKERRLVATRG